MKTYIADIIPRIKRYSQELDNLTLLTNQHWVILDEIQNSKTIYIFRKNKDLIISTNGKVKKAKWDYLGNNSILIDLDDESFLFKHGFFDENILALKIDSKEEYAVLINENKYQGELNSISAVLNFLENTYIRNPILATKKINQLNTSVVDIDYLRDRYTFKMGKHKEFLVHLSNGKTYSIFQKKSDGKYFVYTNSDIIVFPNKMTCLDYIKELV